MASRQFFRFPFPPVCKDRWSLLDAINRASVYGFGLVEDIKVIE
jgi:hypothetical protein